MAGLCNGDCECLELNIWVLITLMSFFKRSNYEWYITVTQGVWMEQYVAAAKWRMYGLRHVYQLTDCKKAYAQHCHKTGVAIRLLKLNTKWMQVVSYTLQPLGRKLEGTRGRRHGAPPLPWIKQGFPRQPAQSPVSKLYKPLWLLRVIFKCVTFGQQHSH